MFTLARKDPQPLSKLEKRIQKLPQHQLLGWADTYLSWTGQALLAQSKEGGDLSLREAEEAATTLLAVIVEMRRRG